MMTCEPLTDCDTEMQPGFSPPEFRASQRVEPGSSEAMQMTAGSGRRLSESFPLSGPLGRCSRILLESETWASPEFYLTWKMKATRCGCSVFQLAPSAPRTEGNGIGLSAMPWKTPAVQEPGVNAERLVTKDGKPWVHGERAYDKETGRLAQTGLPQQFQTVSWPTPAARDIKGQTQNPERMDYVPNIVKATVRPTPKASLVSGGPDPYIKDRKGSGGIATHTALGYGPMPYGCLARTASFVVRLMTLSMWLMGYTAAYLQHWATASSRKLPKGSSQP